LSAFGGLLPSGADVPVGRLAPIADIARRLAEGSIDYLPTVPELMQDGVWPFALQYANDRLDERVDLLSFSKGRP
jgi:hypothetical protein